MNENTPSYLDFFNKVKSYFISYEPNLKSEDVDRYFGTEDVVEMLYCSYTENVEELEANKITLNQMMIGGASSVANCLSLMY